MMPRERTRSTRLFGLMLLPIYTSACLLLFFCYLPLFLLCVAASIASAVPPRVPRQDPPSHSRMAKGLSRICLAHGEGDEGKNWEEFFGVTRTVHSILLAHTLASLFAGKKSKALFVTARQRNC